MTATAMQPVASAAGVRALGPWVLLMSAVALAQTVEKSDSSVTVDELQKQEIYTTAGDWRKAEAKEEEEAAWRKPEAPIAPKSRIEYGYESIYDEARIREEQPRTTLDLEIERYKPDSAFKVKF